jgi:hypothetical protein
MEKKLFQGMSLGNKSITNSFFITKAIYLLCLYDLYVYLAITSEQYNWRIKFFPIPYIFYFDLLVFCIGGIAIGFFLIRKGGRLNLMIGMFFIILNLLLTPLLIASEIN